MMMRKLPIATGMHAWVDYPCASHATQGLPDDAFILVIATTGSECTVRTADGAEFTLPHYALCSGFEFEGRSGNFVPESDPRVLDWLEKRLVTLTTTSWQEGVESDRLAAVENTKKILVRNGRALGHEHSTGLIG
jgi:hypothetical protein